MAEDVASPIDLNDAATAQTWAAAAEARPGRAEMLNRMAAEVAAQGAGRVLELGSGPGVLAARILDRLPGAAYVALDASAAMHDLARARLGVLAAQVTFVTRDFRAADWAAGLGGFDAVVTNQAVHELRHRRHAEGLHRAVRGLLAPGGAYLVSDHLAGPGGMADATLYMDAAGQAAALRAAGFATVVPLVRHGSLMLHRAAG